LNKKDILSTELEKVPEIIKSWQPASAIKKALQKEIDSNFKRMKDPAFGNSFYDYYYIEGSTPEDYRHQVLKLSNGVEIMTGIRFFGLDLSKAYVELVHTNIVELDLNTLNEIASAIVEKYAVFNPFAFRLLYNADLSKKFPVLKIEKDLHLYTGKKSAIVQMDIPIKYDQITLQRPENTDFYSLYKGTLDFFIEENPGSEKYVFTLEKDELEKLLEMGTLFCTYIDDQWAGIMACDEASIQYLNGYLIVEECLTKKYRGKHFAAAIQRKMIEMLPGNEQTLVFGEIHDENIPSRKTASRNGRIVTGSEADLKRSTGFFIFIQRIDSQLKL